MKSDVDELDSKIEAKEWELEKVEEMRNEHANPIPLGRDTPTSLGSEAIEYFRIANKLKEELQDLQNQRKSLRP